MLKNDFYLVIKWMDFMKAETIVQIFSIVHDGSKWSESKTWNNNKIKLFILKVELEMREF